MYGESNRRGGGGGRGWGGNSSGERGGDRGGDRGGRERKGLPLSELDPALTAVSHKVIGCARDVHMNLGQGYDKKAYVEAMKQEMTSQAIPFQSDVTLTVKYKGNAVGTTTADLFIDNRFLIEIMSHPGEVDSWQRLQLRSKLKAADVELGLILNFGGRLLKDGLVRVLNPEKIKALKGDAFSDEHFDDGADAGTDTHQ